jgi:hypothetical protein
MDVWLERECPLCSGGCRLRPGSFVLSRKQLRFDFPIPGEARKPGGGPVQARRRLVMFNFPIIDHRERVFEAGWDRSASKPRPEGRANCHASVLDNRRRGDAPVRYG